MKSKNVMVLHGRSFLTRSYSSEGSTALAVSYIINSKLKLTLPGFPQICLLFPVVTLAFEKIA
jgi:hypothetical protein